MGTKKWCTYKGNYQVCEDDSYVKEVQVKL